MSSLREEKQLVCACGCGRGFADKSAEGAPHKRFASDQCRMRWHGLRRKQALAFMRATEDSSGANGGPSGGGEDKPG